MEITITTTAHAIAVKQTVKLSAAVVTTATATTTPQRTTTTTAVEDAATARRRVVAATLAVTRQTAQRLPYAPNAKVPK